MQVARKLVAARRQLVAAEASDRTAMAGIQAREKDRKWAKF